LPGIRPERKGLPGIITGQGRMCGQNQKNTHEQFPHQLVHTPSPFFMYFLTS